MKKAAEAPTTSLALQDDWNLEHCTMVVPARDWCMAVLPCRVTSGVGDLADRMLEDAALDETKTGVLGRRSR
jgi:hypothetical protein